MTPAEIERLRELRRLRLWHWQQVEQYRAQATAHRNRMRERLMLQQAMDKAQLELRRLHDLASFHLQAVVLLNDFFPVGDTAHRDYVAALKQHTIQNDT